MLSGGLKLLVAHRAFWYRLSHPLAGLALAIGLAIAGLPTVEAQASSLAQTSKQVQASEVGQSQVGQPHSPSPLPTASVFPSDGVYLYGQVPQPGQIGAAYAVMEVRNNQTVGAFYMPQSSFDCFYGEVRSEQLDLTVVNSYEQVAYNYSVPIDQSTSVAVAEGTASAPAQLVGYYAIHEISDIDREILNVCRANYDK